MRFVRFLFGDLHIKVIALLVAAILWFYAILERSHTVSLELPVTVGKIPSGMVVAAVDTSYSRTQLNGKGRDLLLLRLRHPMFRLNLANENPGRARVKLTQEQTNLPTAIQLISAKPEYVTVDLDQQARRQVRVSVPTRGQPPKGYVVTAIKALGPVYLVGPQEEISLYGTVNTESLSLADLSSSAERLLPVLAPSGKRFRVEPETIAVSVKIEQEESRVFPNVSLTVFKPATHAVTVRPAVAQIAVSGASATVRNLTLQEVSATLKLTDTLPKGKYRLPVEITLPPGVTLVKCEPALFDVEIK